MTYYGLCGGVALSNLKNVTCINKGLGSQEQCGKQPGGFQPPSKNVLRQEEIEIITLDSLKIKDVSFIKMDVEENELAVLQGAVHTIKKNKYPPIVFECNDSNLALDTHHRLYIFLTNDLDYITPIMGVTNMFSHKRLTILIHKKLK